MTFDEIVNKVAEDLNLDRKIVDRTYTAYWKTIKDYIESLPLMEDLSEEEFKELKPNINIPSLGKLYVTYERYKYKKLEYKKYKDKENATHKEY